LAESDEFTVFEDPQAGPNQTFATSINNRDQICGFYTDPSGNTLGFIRNSDRNSFRTVKFPTADAFSFVEQINDEGTMAGEYRINFEQGFLTQGTHFLSFDFPNSDSSGLRAVNSAGVVGGEFVAIAGGPTQAYIAIPK
jgi:hypothetical protein